MPPLSSSKKKIESIMKSLHSDPKDFRAHGELLISIAISDNYFFILSLRARKLIIIIIKYCFDIFLF